MGCQRAIGKLAQQVVNNFAANRAATVSDWPLGFISVSVRLVFPPRRARSANVQSLNDFELMDRPVGRGLTL